MVALFVLLMLPAMVIQPAKDSRFLAELMQAHADQGTRQMESSYPLLAQHLSDYLFGLKDSPQVQVHNIGEARPAFSERELLHLEDVRSLFHSFWRMRIIGIVLLFALSILLVLKAEGHRKARLLSLVSVWQRGVLLAGLFLLILSLLASINFYQAFYLMHKVLFTNDLWLLNPQSDLLVQLMPGDVFMAYAKTVGLRLGMTFLGGLVVIVISKKVLQGKEVH